MKQNSLEKAANYGLYRPSFEKDNCGFGVIANIDGTPSHWLVDTAITSLSRMTHRGAIAADGKSGDGCGLLLAMPKAFMREIATENGIHLSAQFAVGMIFLNRDQQLAQKTRDTLEAQLLANKLEFAGWRTVPVDPSACGAHAKASLPIIEQVFVNAPDGMDNDEFARRLFMTRRLTEIACTPEDNQLYIPSLSADIILYKGLVMPADLPVFYTDLSDSRLESSIAVYHQRFSTNTLPEWRLAQPFRHLAHNGEINTIQGNRNWSRARASKFSSKLLPELSKIHPLVSQTGSDSNSLDNMLEVLMMGGMDLFKALRTLLPPAWQQMEEMDEDLRAFLEYNSMHMEPWDGPAGIVTTDGRYAACCLDRNGLRPSRYVLTRDRHITIASEIGVYDYDPADVVAKGRLKPGEILAVDTQEGEILTDQVINDLLKSKQPYKDWLEKNTVRLSKVSANVAYSDRAFETPDTNQLRIYEKLFDVSYEEREDIIRVLAEDAAEATGSMGDDAPYPVFSKLPRSLFDNFRQQFAQVTNPPIDPLREEIVMSLETLFGREKNLFEPTAEHAKRIKAESPVLSPVDFHMLKTINDPAYAHQVIDLQFNPQATNLEAAVEHLCDQAVAAVQQGAIILILSDRNIHQDTLPIPAILATGAVHHRLINEGLRCDANLVIETGSARDSHHFAVLIGYGATAIFPYLACQCIASMSAQGTISDQTPDTLINHYLKGINKGLKKIISKMGISTISSYRGAQLFEIVGMHDEIVTTCFTGTVSRIQGIGYAEIESDLKQLAKKAWNPRKKQFQGGLLKYIYGGEYHTYNPDVVTTLHRAVLTGDYSDYRHYADCVNNRPISVIRDLFDLKTSHPIPVEEVEPEEAIIKRFDSAGMSLGALSPEAHETLAEAMNRLGARSNSGEGGEDKSRYGTLKMSKIKQVASGRFGVTPHYLTNAEVLQIKIAQGAKPGEGGQLPGHKVDSLIAKLRHSSPGVTLISPPPHHDIYSIEDLAQLIFDLKEINPDALVSVKLVAKPGVGTIAAGVAKAYADLITISGYDGGTAASPISSVKYAGSPWELGLSETHQTLRANDLRSKVRLQTDGGLKTGLDVVKAAILGAESFAFGTGPMIAMGCKFLRICHLNNCATGVATQNQVLRMQHFHGNVEKVIHYIRFIARDTRELMASLGVRSMEELIGRTDLLTHQAGETVKQQRLDLSQILSDAGVPAEKPQFCTEPCNPPHDKAITATHMLNTCQEAIKKGKGGTFSFDVRNTDRSIGAKISGEIARHYGDQGMPASPLRLNLKGTAGQSLGVWNSAGLELYLEGDANDYVGKGMAGGKIVIHPPATATFESQENTIIGNTCLYGATGGSLFAAGTAGERFGVRNSGANAVVEGVGAHGCEYMTGGIITILGGTGVNFGAGMTGGVAFVLDSEHAFTQRCNHELITLHRVNTPETAAYRDILHQQIQQFVNETQSVWGRKILANFETYLNDFWLVAPKSAELTTLLSTLSKAA